MPALIPYWLTSDSKKIASKISEANVAGFAQLGIGEFNRAHHRAHGNPLFDKTR